MTRKHKSDWRYVDGTPAEYDEHGNVIPRPDIVEAMRASIAAELVATARLLLCRRVRRRVEASLAEFIAKHGGR
jgi:hypothetical protein